MDVTQYQKLKKKKTVSKSPNNGHNNNNNYDVYRYAGYSGSVPNLSFGGGRAGEEHYLSKTPPPSNRKNLDKIPP